MTDISVRTAVSERSLLRQLTVIQSRRFARHPLYLAGVALLVMSTVAAIDDAPGDPSTFAGIGWSAAFLLGVFGFVVSYRLTRSDESAVALLPSAPLDPTTRVLALVGACLVPMGTAVVFLLVRLVGYTVWAPYAGLVDAMGGPAVVLVSLLDGAVVACFGGPVLGVAAGRWLRFPGAGVIAALLLVLVVAAFSGGANQLSDDTTAGPDGNFKINGTCTNSR